MTPNLYQRKPVPVQVRFATEAGEAQTLNGPVAYQAGDVVFTEIRKSPLPRPLFEALFECTSPLLSMGQDGIYQCKPSPVVAYQLGENAKVAFSNKSKAHGGVGDWVLQQEDGTRSLASNKFFLNNYQLIDCAETKEKFKDLLISAAKV